MFFRWFLIWFYWVVVVFICCNVTPRDVWTRKGPLMEDGNFQFCSTTPEETNFAKCRSWECAVVGVLGHIGPLACLAIWRKKGVVCVIPRWNKEVLSLSPLHPPKYAMMVSLPPETPLYMQCWSRRSRICFILQVFSVVLLLASVAQRGVYGGRGYSYFQKRLLLTHPRNKESGIKKFIK